MKIEYTPYCDGCFGHDCQSCNVLRDWIKSKRYCSDSIESKQDFDLENHFVGGL